MHKKDIHLVLIHGFMFNRTAWEKPAEILAEDYTVHIIDLPGYGKNSDVKAQSLDEIAQHVMTQIGDAQNIIWVGWSLGGIVGTYLAHQLPDITRGVITITTNPKFLKSDDWPCGGSYGAFSAFKNAFVRQPKIALKRFIILQSQYILFASSKNIPKLQAYIESLPLETILRDLDLLEHTDLRPIISTLTVPQLNILADSDRLIPIAVFEELNRLSPHAQNVIMKKAGHAILISHMDECLTLMQKFINESIITQ